MLRTVLFCPANDQKKALKAMASDADAIALDLEDAVAYSQKNTAREMLTELLSQPPSKKVFVRINAADSKYILDDILSVVSLPLDGLMLAKVKSPEDVLNVSWLLGLIEKKRGITPGKTRLIPFIESSHGVLSATEIASCSHRIMFLAFGGVDFSQEIGLRYPEESEGLFFARNQLILASFSAGINPPLDTVFPDIKNPKKLRLEAETARTLGYQGKLVIHPVQISPVNQAFTPTEEEINYARQILAVFYKSEQDGKAVAQIKGKMIEYPHIKRAKELLKIFDKINKQ